MAKGAGPRMRVVISPKVRKDDFSRLDANRCQLCADGHAHQTDRLSTLPDELTLMVWKNLNRDTDKTCLALTCKSNAQFYNSLGTASRPVQRTSPEQKLNLLHRLRGFSTLRKYKLCFKCVRYKPRRGEWGGFSKYARLRNLSRSQRIMGPNCEYQ